MKTYIIRRVLLLIPTFFLVTILVFLSVRFIPGDVVDMLLYRMEVGAGGGDAMDREKLERRLGLDVPAYVQYTRWMGGILLRGDLGKPLLKAEPVGQLIAGRLPTTIELGLVSILIGLLIGVPIGIYSAINRTPWETTPVALSPSLAWRRPTSGWPRSSSSSRRSGGAGRRRCAWCALATTSSATLASSSCRV